jgi:isopentenyl diphosphate isomerase/L-lactate dehydrogenase-like FMN-dependent dehydrogenase
MSRRAFAYVAGGAGLESTMSENRNAFERWQIVPRIFHDVSERDTSVEIFGRRLPTPFLLAPVGVLALAHRDGDLAAARGAAAEGVPMIFSNQASIAMEVCASAMGDAPRWFQLYWSTSDEVVRSLVHRAEACGCGAIVATLDTTLFGWRPRDLDLAFLPFIYGAGIAQYTSDPVFMELATSADEVEETPRGRITPAMVRTFIRQARAHPGSFWKNVRSGIPLRAVVHFVRTYSRPSLTWNDVAFLRGLTDLPILLKGVLHADDARIAAEHGIDGIVVSNHGGRQIDGEIASIDVLPEIVDAVRDRLIVLLDSGVRGGADTFKALALGARAVLLGRPYVYGLALAGETGVREVIRNFTADFDLTMGLTGCASIADITPQALRRAA